MTDEQVDVWNEVEGVLEQVRGKADAKGLSLEFKVYGLVRVGLDRLRFRQVVFNLLDNAIKATDHGSVQVAVWKNETAKGMSYLCLKVSDSGIGMRREDVARIMRPYGCVASAVGPCGETGQGLETCRRIVEGLGGRIEVESELGVGTSFTVLFPERSVAPVESAPEPKAPHPLRILVVDDIEANRTLLLMMCRRLGHRDCQEAASAEKALELMHATRFDLVLSDKKMPGMDGVAFIHAVRADPELSNTRIYLVTADDEIVSQYLQLGADGVLVKPVTFERLEMILDRCG